MVKPHRVVVFLVLAVVLTACKKKSAAPNGAAAGAGGARAGSDRKQPVEVTTITRRDMSETLSVVGSLAANESVTIRPEISGLVRAINFEEGQPVKAGQLLVKIDDGEMRAQFAQSEAKFQLAQLNLQRAENLRQSQSNTQADVDRARSEFAAAEADLQLLKIRLARTELKAPFDGVVGARTLSAGDYVTTQSVVTTLDDVSRLKIDFQVPERFLAKVAPGTKFTVLARSGEAGDKSIRRVQGDVYFVSSSIDRATRSSQVKGFLGAAPAGLRPGMFANVELVLAVRERVLTVPEGSILADTRGPRVIAVAEKGGEKIVEHIPVKLGLRSRGLVEIAAVNGQLEEGRQIVASGVGGLNLFQGAKIEPRPLRAEFVPRED